jgi:hypothetical protein
MAEMQLVAIRDLANIVQTNQEIYLPFDRDSDGASGAAFRTQLAVGHARLTDTRRRLTKRP